MSCRDSTGNHPVGRHSLVVQRWWSLWCQFQWGLPLQGPEEGWGSWETSKACCTLVRFEASASVSPVGATIWRFKAPWAPASPGTSLYTFTLAGLGSTIPQQEPELKPASAVVTRKVCVKTVQLPKNFRFENLEDSSKLRRFTIDMWGTGCRDLIVCLIKACLAWTLFEKQNKTKNPLWTLRQYVIL